MWATPVPHGRVPMLRYKRISWQEKLSVSLSLLHHHVLLKCLTNIYFGIAVNSIMTLASLKIQHSQLALGMSISRECIWCSAYNQIISRGYQGLSSHLVNYVLHLTEPHTDRKKARLKMSHKKKKKSNILFPLSFLPSFLHLPHPPHPQTKYRDQIPKGKLKNSPSDHQQIIFTWDAKIKCDAQIRMSSHMEDGKWGTPEHALGSSVSFAALSSSHSTAQERQILRLTPEPWLFLPLIVRVDPGYRNVNDQQT